MKTILIKSLLLAASTGLFLSCERQVELPLQKKAVKAPNEQMTVLSDNLLQFGGTDNFYEEVNAISANTMSADQKQRHSQFTSLSEVHKEALTQLVSKTPEVVLENLKSKYGSNLKIVIRDNTLDLDQFSTTIAQIVNPQGQVMIAGRLFEFSSSKIDYTVQPYIKLENDRRINSIVVTSRTAKSTPNARPRPFYGSGTGYFFPNYGNNYVTATISDYVYNMPYYQPVDPNLRGSYDERPQCDDYMYSPTRQNEYRGTVQRVSITAHAESRTAAGDPFSSNRYNTEFRANWSFYINGSETKNYYVECYQNGQETANSTTTDVGNRSGEYYLDFNGDWEKYRYDFTIYDAPANADISNFQSSFAKKVVTSTATATISW